MTDNPFLSAEVPHRNPRPSIDQIRERLDRIWSECFPHRGPLKESFRIEFNTRLRTTAGRANPSVLVLNPKHFDQHGWGQELNDVIRHEIIHVSGVLNHGWDFHREMARIGADRHCKGAWMAKIKTAYLCRACGHSFASLGHEEECPQCGDLIDQVGTVEG